MEWGYTHTLHTHAHTHCTHHALQLCVLSVHGMDSEQMVTEVIGLKPTLLPEESHYGTASPLQALSTPLPAEEMEHTWTWGSYIYIFLSHWGCSPNIKLYFSKLLRLLWILVCFIVCNSSFCLLCSLLSFLWCTMHAIVHVRTCTFVKAGCHPVAIAQVIEHWQLGPWFNPWFFTVL